MNTGKVIGGILVAGAVGAAAYLAYKKFAAPASDSPPPPPPPGTPTGVQQYIDQAGNIVDQVTQFLPKNTAGMYEGKLIRIDKDRVYFVKDGLLRYVPTMPKFYSDIQRTLNWPVDYELRSSNIPKGPDLKGLGCAASLLL